MNPIAFPSPGSFSARKTPDDAERARPPAQSSGAAPDPALVRDELLHELFEATVDAQAGRTALLVGNAAVTYSELDERANRIAHLLRERGVRRGMHVGLLLPRSADLYAALLGILKAGAAYVPLDPEYPAERVAQILTDSAADFLVTFSGLEARVGPGPHTTVLLDREDAALGAQPAARISRGQTQATPADPCYAIFTSGSTGRPKGVSIAHRSVCHLVRAEAEIFQVHPQDRVFQGFSIAFDASVEEIWLAFFAGAALVAASAEDMRSGPALPARLTRSRVTVLSTVPTLLSTFDEDVPCLRLLILGGESCPPDLVERWAKPGRRVVNTYGPTEATVIATFTDLEPGAPVTIGHALPNYRTFVLDEQLRPVGPGEAGELCLSGIGLSLGYLGRPDLTRERFVPNPYADGPFTEFMYRTGDLVRYTPQGELEFLGRIDEQVKIRGYRVELGEIEATLRRRAEIRAAAAAVVRTGEIEQLVGYVVPKGGETIDERAVRDWLLAQLPSYMVPSVIEVLAELPTLASGKVDRRRLPAPRARRLEEGPQKELPKTEAERRLVACWSRVFHREDIGLDDDFFVNLGGHSLVAAVMVSGLRKETGFESLAVPDVYAFPTPRRLAAEMTARASREHELRAGRAPAPKPVSPAGRFVSHAAQSVGLYGILGYFGIQWLAPYLTYGWMTDHDFDTRTALLAALGGLLLVYPAMFVLSIAIKWIVLGRIKPGLHRVWSFYYLRFWFVNRIVSGTPTEYLVGTPWLPIYLRLMGAKIGRDTHFATDCVRAFDLLTVGDDSSIGVDARLEGYKLENGFLKIGSISIGTRCYVGARSVIGTDTLLESGAWLGELSLLPEGGRIPEGQRWLGSPARPQSETPEDRARAATEPRRASRTRKFQFLLLHGAGVLLVPLAFVLAICPGMLTIGSLYFSTPGYFGYLWVVPFAAISYLVLLLLEIAVLKWLLLGRVRPGVYDVYGSFYLRKWFVDQLMELSLDLLGPLYATLYLNPWYRLLGAKVGSRAEISTAGAATPDLLDIGDESFIADAVSLGTPRYDLGRMTLLPTRVGKRAFVGNSAVVPGGTSLSELTLIGVLSAPPLAADQAGLYDASWLGSPAIFLPRRQRAAGFREQQTFRPSGKAVALRLFVEFFRVTLPAVAFALLTCLILTAMTEIEDRVSLAAAAAAFPLLYFAGGIAACLFVAGAKWLLMGRYRPSEKPLWCAFVWGNELVTALHECLADSWLLELCKGTPLLPSFFRLLGSRIGKGVCMETTWLTEYDLISIGDDACLNADCTLQTHLFEDRVMKMSTVEIGRGSTVGTDAVVLYDTRVEDGAALGDLSLLMKGEVLPAGSTWVGSPARLAPRQLEVTRGGAPLENPPSATEKPDVVVVRADRGARAIARSLLSSRLGVDLDITANSKGCPVAHAAGHTLAFSQSSTASAYAAAVKRAGRLGVDLTPLDTASSRSLVDHFSPSEREWLRRLGPCSRCEAVCECWAAKEAVLKALGFGLGFGPDQVELAPDGRGSLRVARVAGSEALAAGWQLDVELLWSPEGPLVLALAWGA